MTPASIKHHRTKGQAPEAREAQTLVANLAMDLANETDHANSLLLFWQTFHDEFGFISTSLVYICLVISFIFIIVFIPDNSYMSNTKHVKIVTFKTNTLLKSYIYSAARNMNTINTVALVYLMTMVFIMFYLHNFILYTVILLAFNGIYYYISTQNIRHILYRFHYKPWKDYLYLIVSQIIIIYAVSLPILAVGLFLIDHSMHIFLPYLIVTLGILLFVLLGILFPPYNDNPFSIITSIFVIIIPIFILGLSLAFLNLGTFANVLIVIFFYITIILFSIKGLTNLQRSSRYEANV